MLTSLHAMMSRKKGNSSSVTPVAPQATSSSPTVASDSKEAGILKKRTQSALEHSITAGIFIDTRFYLFSRRTRDGARVSCPLPVYANSQVLVEATEYFKTCRHDGHPIFGPPSRCEHC